ncbi:ABC transporter ATP-binding protein [Xanthobacter dioxanivorans]|uniref:ABC transporter ATP-binding protein n=1 Tax=Xanthobacter dioxanivorans TaxID=2528964 RepID=A0A974SJS4_9HYPH|nr:ABC transporter ATP-binding protein [Xanthobacter dioxanivorans]QRG07777.1 ABC transporter ATP-binding protein [Xanthobacter dioxanivorans]
MAAATLELWKVAKRFQGVVAVDCVSLTAAAGRVTGLIGPNGSGKTTTMNMITGLYPTDAGHIRLDGVDIARLPPHRVAALGVARTFQNIRLLATETTLANVLLGAHRHQSAGLLDVLLGLPAVKRSEARETARCEALLELIGISHLRDVPVGGLSYGDRRRVEIARALATKPRLLLLDEPAAGMNFAEKQALADLVLAIRDMGVTVLVIEHDIEFVARVSDHIVVLNFGREIAAGTPEEVRSMPSVIEAYLGTEDA